MAWTPAAVLALLGAALVAGLVASVAWRAGWETTAYWLRVTVGAADAGLIAGLGTLLAAGADLDLTQVKMTVEVTQGRLAFAGLVGAMAMAKDVRSYIKVPSGRLRAEHTGGTAADGRAKARERSEGRGRSG